MQSYSIYDATCNTCYFDVVAERERNPDPERVLAAKVNLDDTALDRAGSGEGPRRPL